MDYSPPGSSVHGDSLGMNTGIGCHFLLQGILQTQELNLRLLPLLHWQAGSLPLAPPGKRWIFLQCRRTQFNSWVRKIPWRRDRLPTPVFLDFPGVWDGKESTCNVGYLGSIPGLGRSPRRGHGNLLQYSCLENLHGQRSLVGYSPWDHKESDTTEWLSTHTHTHTHTRTSISLSFYEPLPTGKSRSVQSSWG